MVDNSSNLIQILTLSMDKISQANNDFEINDILEKLLIKFTDSDIAEILIFNREKQELYTKKEKKSTLSMISPEGLLGYAFLSKEPAYYNHPISEKHYDKKIDNNYKKKIKCQMIIPILEDDEPLGIIRVSRKLYHNIQYKKKDIDLILSLHTFIVKIIHILTNNKNNNSHKDMDTSDITQKIKDVESNKVENINHAVALSLLSNAVHDIRTPANSLYGFLDLLADQIDDEQIKELIKDAKDSASFINTLTDSILEQAKVSYSMNQINLNAVNSVKYFSQIANMFTANMSDKNIRYLIFIDPSIPKEIKIDDNKVKRIITNLIGNAYKFTPNGKSIKFSIKLDKNKQALNISVADTGIGIEDSKQKEIFKEFTQENTNTYDKYGGTGLGLSISSQYVNTLGGKLELTSTVDVGSKFYFTLPIEIVNAYPSYEKFKNLNKKVTLFSANLENLNISNIFSYLLELGMPKEKIFISSTLDIDTTHLFCFEDKLSSDILDIVKKHKMKLVIIEKELFSLSKKLKDLSIDIISENTYYGNMVHSMVFSEKKKRILIADDNKLNIKLLTYMLETSHVDITSVLDGEEALNILKKSQFNNNNRFDVVFLDNNMPILSGNKVLSSLRKIEQEENLKPIFAISITGDPTLNESEKNLYNLMVQKPFNKENVRDALKKVK